MNKEMKDKSIKIFFDNLEKSEKLEIINLRRNYNKNFRDVNEKCIISFYKILPSQIRYKEYLWFFIATLYAFQRNKNEENENISKSMPITKAIKFSDDDNIKRKFNIILTEDLSIESLMLYKIGQLVRLLNNQGVYIDSQSLLEDLLNWNLDSKIIQKKWAKDVYSQEFNLEGENEDE